MYVTKRSGKQEAVDMAKYERKIDWACEGLLGVDPKVLKTKARQPLYPGIPTIELDTNLKKQAADLIGEHPNWTYVAARFALQEVYKAANPGNLNSYPSLKEYFARSVLEANVNPLIPTLFDLEELDKVVRPLNDFNFDYLGMSTVADRYLLRNANKELLELPQHWLMRVAMGVASHHPSLNKRMKAAVEHYELLSSFEFMSSTPTLFNASLKRAQLSSCFGIKIGDSFESIWDGMREAASYSKYGGGIAMDVTDIRGKGAPIRSMGGEAGGPIPYVKLANDTMIAFDQQGKRKGSVVVYMELWHVGINDFLSLREPGDHNMRAHESFMSNWIPDLFMERLQEEGYWSLFDPIDTPDLHSLHGQAFKERYEHYERLGIAKRVVDTQELWETMITRLFAHGVFWHCYKDRMNERYTMRDHHAVHSSNLCTEIALRSAEDVSFVCNLGSINLSLDTFHVKKDESGKWLWNHDLEDAVRKGLRFLDSVITVGYTPSERGRSMQEQDRPVGMGCMGWVTALYKLGIDYESAEHIHYCNEVYKQISLTATHESALLARELGSFPTFHESRWAKGELIQDTFRHTKVVDEFVLDLTADNCPFATLEELRELVRGGMRNSTLLAIAPTATISNIIGVDQCTELPWDLIFDKKNLSGKFKMNSKIVDNNLYGLPLKTAYMVDHTWTVRAAAARGIWIDQSQSTNFFVNTSEENAGDKVSDLYKSAWAYGLKTTYYLYGRSEGEITSQTSPLDQIVAEPVPDPEGAACFLRPGDEGFADCEACQ